MNSKKNKASLNGSITIKSVMIVTLITGKLFLSSLSATEDSSNQIKNQAIYIYNKAMEAVKDAKNSGQTNKEISDIYIYYAGRSRDAGHHVYAEKLFKTALEIDPTNARGHRIYGDYLMGYRGTGGQYEYASYHYYQAQKLLDKQNPGNIESEESSEEDDLDAEQKRLSRSIDIMYRDGKNGIALHRSDKFSTFLTLSTAYKKNTPSTMSVLAMQNRIEGLRDDTLANDAVLDRLLVANGGQVTNKDETIDFIDLNNDGIAEAVSINDLQQRNSEVREPLNAFLENASRFLTFRQETKVFKASLLTRFGNPSLPYFRITTERVEIDKSGYVLANIDDSAAHVLNPILTEGIFKRTAITVGKNGFLPYTIDWNTELEVDLRTNKSENPLTKNEVEKEDTSLITGRLVFAKFFPHQVLKLNLGGSLVEVNNNGDSDDTGNEANASIRYSIFPEPEKNIETNERFRGRRSSHFEGGIQRKERIFKRSFFTNSLQRNSAAKQTFYEPFFTYEEFGLAE